MRVRLHFRSCALNGTHAAVLAGLRGAISSRGCHEQISSAVVLAATMMGILPANAADSRSPLVGTWRVTSLASVTADGGEITHPFDDQVAGYVQYSPGRHMVVFLSTANPKRPASAAYTDAERAEIYKGIFGAYAGTYSVDGNKVTHHIVASWRPDWIGGDQIRYFELNGNTLTLKTAPINSALRGKPIVATLTFERIE